ncbi:MAG TPA: response regulator [Bryobacteraceae bacterium]|nr:response regulator [Bryobacteraceae bacterium]
MRSASFSNRAPIQACILLVDDNCDGILARRSVLEELGYLVVTAGCGSDALQIAGERTFDLVITDYKMSPMDGLELISNLRGRNVKTPIILLTGFAESLGLRSSNTGADVVIQKSANEVANLMRHTKRLLNPRKPASSQATPKAAGARTGSGAQ